MWFLRAVGPVRPRVTLLLALVWASLCGCYARTVPLAEPPPVHALSRPLPGTAGVRLAPGADASALAVALQFAQALEAAELFDRVVFPHTAQAPTPVDIVLDLHTTSTPDHKALANLVKDLAVGASLLVLQPVLPTRYDLAVEVGVEARRADGFPVGRYLGRSVTSFESNHLRTEGAALEAWRREAVQRAVDAAISELLDARAELGAAAAATVPE